MSKQKPKSRPKYQKNGAKHHLVTLLLALCYSIIVGLFVFIIVRDHKQLNYSEKTTAIVDLRDIDVRGTTPIPSTYAYKYYYTVGGKQYTGGYSSDYERFKSGEVIPIYYVHDNPRESRPEIALRETIITYALGAAMVLAALAGLLYLLFRVIYKPKQGSSILGYLILATLGLMLVSIGVVVVFSQPVIFGISLVILFMGVLYFIVNHRHSRKPAN